MDRGSWGCKESDMIEHTFYRIGMLVLKFMRWAKKLKGFFLEQKKTRLTSAGIAMYIIKSQ